MYPVTPSGKIAGRVRSVFLVGFMGAGKTSVGRLLAELLGWPFVDLDDRIEARERRKIADIFHDSGEPAFRAAETAALGALLSEIDRRPAVVALGGGAFVQPENANLLRQNGARVVFLDAELDELRRRCAPKGEQRPLFQDANGFRQLYELRRPSYLRAHIRVDSTGMSIAEAAAEVTRQLGISGQDNRK